MSRTRFANPRCRHEPWSIHRNRGSSSDCGVTSSVCLAPTSTGMWDGTLHSYGRCATISYLFTSSLCHLYSSRILKFSTQINATSCRKVHKQRKSFRSNHELRDSYARSDRLRLKRSTHMRRVHFCVILRKVRQDLLSFSLTHRTCHRSALHASVVATAPI